MSYCKNMDAPGGCQLHNLQCGYPECDMPPVKTLVDEVDINYDASHDNVNATDPDFGKAMYRGKRLKDMSREELYKAMDEMHKLLDEHVEWNNRMWDKWWNR